MEQPALDRTPITYVCMYAYRDHEALVPHLLAKQPFSLLQPSDDSGPCNGKGALHIFLYFGVGVTHLGNQQVQQDHNHSKKEGEIQNNREPPGEGRGED